LLTLSLNISIIQLKKTSSTLDDLPPYTLQDLDRFRADAEHRPVGIIKGQAQVRISKTRQVRLVYRDADLSRDTGLKTGLGLTNNHTLLHWALQIGDERKYFELTPFYGSDEALSFIQRTWNVSQLKTMSTDCTSIFIFAASLLFMAEIVSAFSSPRMRILCSSASVFILS
jgi:hypothetical protein